MEIQSSPDFDPRPMLLDECFHGGKQFREFLVSQKPDSDTSLYVRQIARNELRIEVWVDKQKVLSREFYGLPDLIEIVEYHALTNGHIGRSHGQHSKVGSGLMQ